MTLLVVGLAFGSGCSDVFSPSSAGMPLGSHSTPSSAPPSLAAATGARASGAAAIATSSPEPATPQEVLPSLSETGITGLPMVTSEQRAVPIVAGTLLLSRDERYAIISDPDRDSVYVVDVAEQRHLSTVDLEAGDEPAAAAEDASGVVHVALRRGGAVVGIDLPNGVVVHRTAVCSAPRGVAVRDSTGEVLVACQGGEVVVLPVSGGDAQIRAYLPSDLRDIATTEGGVLITRFRSADVLTLDDAYEIVATTRPPTVFPEPLTLNEDGSYPGAPGVFQATMALGLEPTTSGDLVMVHQRANLGKLVPAYYPTLGCNGGIVHSAVSRYSLGTGSLMPLGVLPRGFISDFAVAPDGETLILATLELSVSRVYQLPMADRAALGACGSAEVGSTTVPGQVTAVALTSTGTALAFVREPARLHIFGGASIQLSEEPRADTGHIFFHHASPLGIACATCHREGGDDGVTYLFSQFGQRRTQSLAGGLLATAPYHWEGERQDIAAVLLDTWATRMGGESPSSEQAQAIGRWLDSVPAPPPAVPADRAASARGREIFERADCARCHAGVVFTDNLSWDIGKGGEVFQTPSLIGLGARAPYMHDGCALTVRDRFEAECGGSSHGELAGLSGEDLDALSAYLLSL